MTDIETLLETISNPKTMEINSWPWIPLNNVKNYSNILRNKPGVYAISDQNSRLLYLGKARSVYNRLISHHNATTGKEKAEAWAQFFNHFNSDLRAHYYIMENISEVNIEKANQALERILQIRHSTLFDQIYNTKGKRAVADFDECLSRLNYNVGKAGDQI